jgi:hypothetical protein
LDEAASKASREAYFKAKDAAKEPRPPPSPPADDRLKWSEHNDQAAADKQKKSREARNERRKEKKKLCNVLYTNYMEDKQKTLEREARDNAMSENAGEQRNEPEREKTILTISNKNGGSYSVPSRLHQDFRQGGC